MPEKTEHFTVVLKLQNSFSVLNRPHVCRIDIEHNDDAYGLFEIDTSNNTLISSGDSLTNALIVDDEQKFAFSFLFKNV